MNGVGDNCPDVAKLFADWAPKERDFADFAEAFVAADPLPDGGSLESL